MKYRIRKITYKYSDVVIYDYIAQYKKYWWSKWKDSKPRWGNIEAAKSWIDNNKTLNEATTEIIPYP